MPTPHIESFPQFFDALERNYANDVSFRFFRENELISVTYAEFIRDVRRFAAHLAADCPQVKERHIGILANTSYDYILALFAIWLSGGVCVPLNTIETAESLQSQILFSDTDFVFVGKEYHDVFASMDGLRIRPLEGFADGWKPDFAPVVRDGDELALMLFTSGTTSTSKCVMLAQKSLLFHIPFTSSEYSVHHILLINPLPHIMGMKVLFTSIFEGCENMLCLSSRYIFRDLEASGAETMHVVPAVMNFLHKSIRREGRAHLGKLNALFVGGAPMNSEKVDLFLRNGIHLFTGYGLTEACFSCANNPLPDLSKLGSVGLPGNGVEIRIIDGEVCFKADYAMIGYYKNPKATAEVLCDGWLHTGDLGYFDEDGYLYITGRRKNLILLESGENICPEELEALLSRNADILEVLVKEKDQKVCAEIYCDAGKQDSIREFIRETNGRIAFCKHITLVEFRTAPFERTATGKIRRV